MPYRFKPLAWVGKAARFYRQGLQGMTLGRSLWWIVAIKIVIIFGILKFFFFPDFLGTHFRTDRERADFVLEQITNPESSTPSGGELDD